MEEVREERDIEMVPWDCLCFPVVVFMLNLLRSFNYKDKIERD